MNLISFVHVLISFSLLTACGEKNSPVRKNFTDESADRRRNLTSAYITNLDSIIASLPVGSLHQQGYKGAGVKIAVFDNGFLNYEKSLGSTLPPDAIFEAYPGVDPSHTEHGTKMAEVAYAVATGSPVYSANHPGPTLHLFNTSGFINLRAAISRAIALKVDIILYAQIWDYGGNMDGKGYINREVNRATGAGITWINASGNYNGTSYKGPVNFSQTAPHQLTWPTGSGLDLLVRREHPRDIRIGLGWNDFTDSPHYQTQQDLDLFLINPQGEVIAQSTRWQKPQPDAKRPSKDFTKHAYEKIRATVTAGTYKIKVTSKNPEAFHQESKLWVTVNGEEVYLPLESLTDSIFIPADNPNVTTVSAKDSGFSSFGQQHPPDINAVSLVRYSNGDEFTGTSTATAVAVGAAATLKSAGSNHNALKL